MPSRKRGAKKTVKKEESLVDENTAVFKETVYNVESKPELKETPVIAINTIEQPALNETSVIETSEKKPMKKEIKVLVILVIILLIVDVLSLYLYYKPDLSEFTNFFKFKSGKVVEDSNNSNECKDGTMQDSCSKDKPYYCVDGNLLKKAATCGCPSGYKLDFQDCKKI
ncbi:hypothetical protein J4429_02300 [Candidatus Pacearchaeota archaeon]|nr:hypothetical protein [Candidatus Pacearchaeota archaeon]